MSINDLIVSNVEAYQSGALTQDLFRQYARDIQIQMSLELDRWIIGKISDHNQEAILSGAKVYE